MRHFNMALESVSGFAFQETTEEISNGLKGMKKTVYSQPTYANAPNLRPNNQFQCKQK